MLDIDQLSFAYGGNSTPVIENLSCTQPSGRITGLLGANGVGKSTLLKLIAGLLFPSSGKVLNMGRSSEQRSAEMLSTMYLVPEKTWLPDMNSNTYTKLYAPLYPKFDSRLFDECINRFELPSRKNLLALSYGQQKKFLIAFGLATRATLFLFDEPTNGLDIPSKEQFRQLILENLSDEQSAIISTHQAHDLQGMVDSVMLMDQNQLISATLDEFSRVFSVEKLESVPSNALYSVQNFNQWLCLIPFDESSQRELDLEFLFNAFHQNKQAFLQQLGSQTTANKNGETNVT